jgi:hypothetical protein
MIPLFFTSGTEGTGGWHTDVHWHFGLHIALFYRRGLVKLIPGVHSKPAHFLDPPHVPSYLLLRKL